MISPLEICLPNYALFVPILRISRFPWSSSEVKLRRELVEEHANWNVEHETLSGISVAKLSQSYFHLKEKHSEITSPASHTVPRVLRVCNVQWLELSIRERLMWLDLVSGSWCCFGNLREL